MTEAETRALVVERMAEMDGRWEAETRRWIVPLEHAKEVTRLLRDLGHEDVVMRLSGGPLADD